jgi:hypothetical protein
MRRRLLFPFLLISAALAACGRGSAPAPSAGAPVTLSSAEAPMPHPSENGRARLRTLEANLEYGKAWGSDAMAKNAAVAVHGALVREAWLEHGDVAVAVEILPYQPRKIVTLVKLKYLTDQKSDRRVYLNVIQTAVEEQAAKQDEITIGLRGALAYGAVAMGRNDGTAWVVHLTNATSDPLERALTTSK